MRVFMKSLQASMILAILTPVAQANAADGYRPEAKFVYPERNQQFGRRLALDGDTVAVSGFGLDLFAYRYDPDLARWVEEAEMLVTDEGWFGSIAIEGDTIIVGSPEVGVNDDGATFIFERLLPGSSEWVETAKLEPKELDSHDNFGDSVAISGNTLAVGASGDDDSKANAGAVYIYERDPGAPSVWLETDKLTLDNAWFGLEVGDAIAIDGDTLVVGNSGDRQLGDRAGAIYIFERNDVSGWQEQHKLTASDGLPVDLLGDAVAIEGNVIVAGAVGVDDFGSISGAAYVFERNPQNGTWHEVSKLTPREGNLADQFGVSVSISGDRVAVGAWTEDAGSTDTGAVYVFEREEGIGPLPEWTQVARLVAPDRDEDDAFGYAVAIDDDVVIGGAILDDHGADNSGSFYAFRTAPIDPILEVEGSCPGSITLTAHGLTPGHEIELWAGASFDHTVLTTGPCTGAELGLSSPSLVLTNDADRLGELEATRTLGSAQCGKSLQLLDISTCTVTDPVDVPLASD